MIFTKLRWFHMQHGHQHFQFYASLDVQLNQGHLLLHVRQSHVQWCFLRRRVKWHYQRMMLKLCPHHQQEHCLNLRRDAHQLHVLHDVSDLGYSVRRYSYGGVVNKCGLCEHKLNFMCFVCERLTRIHLTNRLCCCCWSSMKACGKESNKNK